MTILLKSDILILLIKDIDSKVVLDSDSIVLENGLTREEAEMILFTRAPYHKNAQIEYFLQTFKPEVLLVIVTSDKTNMIIDTDCASINCDMSIENAKSRLLSQYAHLSNVSFEFKVLYHGED